MNYLFILINVFIYLISYIDHNKFATFPVTMFIYQSGFFFRISPGELYSERKLGFSIWKQKFWLEKDCYSWGHTRISTEMVKSSENKGKKEPSHISIPLPMGNTNLRTTKTKKERPRPSWDTQNRSKRKPTKFIVVLMTIWRTQGRLHLLARSTYEKSRTGR
jgi:hypothetical protein